MKELLINHTHTLYTIIIAVKTSINHQLDKSICAPQINIQILTKSDFDESIHALWAEETTSTAVNHLLLQIFQ